MQPPTEFTQEICELLYRTPKYVASQINWEPRTPDVFIFRAKVLTDDGIGLDLTGHWKRNGRFGRTLWGFDLRYRRRIVRGYDMAAKHKNPGGGGHIRGPHKHRFSSSKIDRFAYLPQPPISTADANQALLDFLKECNIRFRTGDRYQAFMFP